MAESVERNQIVILINNEGKSCSNDVRGARTKKFNWAYGGGGGALKVIDVDFSHSPTPTPHKLRPLPKQS